MEVLLEVPSRSQGHLGSCSTLGIGDSPVHRQGLQSHHCVLQETGPGTQGRVSPVSRSTTRPPRACPLLAVGTRSSILHFLQSQVRRDGKGEFLHSLAVSSAQHLRVPQLPVVELCGAFNSILHRGSSTCMRTRKLWWRLQIALSLRPLPFCPSLSRKPGHESKYQSLPVVLLDIYIGLQPLGNLVAAADAMGLDCRGTVPAWANLTVLLPCSLTL